MKVTEHDVLYVADLANLELTADERGRMLRDLNSILDYMDRLNRLDTSDVEPMSQTVHRYGTHDSRTASAPFAYATRGDKTGPSLDRDDVMRNAPETDGTFFKVPKVIEK